MYIYCSVTIHWVVLVLNTEIVCFMNPEMYVRFAHVYIRVIIYYNIYIYIYIYIHVCNCNVYMCIYRMSKNCC